MKSVLTSIINPVRSWPEAVILSEPGAKPDKPVVLVRRRRADLEGPDGQELVYFPGNPAISLFTGAGGFDIGMEAAGFCCVCQHEWNPGACETLIANRPRYFRDAALIQGDIRQTPTSMLLKEGGLEVGETHAVIGGPPCQGFSTANTHALKNREDRRNDLVFEYLRVVREAKPKFFVFENVSGFLSFNRGEYVREFLATAYECYYDLCYGLIDCCDYGVPQWRCRFICMGTRRDLSEGKGFMASLPDPTHFDKKDIQVLRKAEKRPMLISMAEDIRRTPGIRYFPDRPVLIPPAPNGPDGRTDTFTRFYRHLEETEPDRLISRPRSAA